MRTMIDLASGGQKCPLNVIDTATSIDCGRQVRFRRSFRTLVECMVPACCFASPDAISDGNDTDSVHSSGCATISATFFGRRKGRVSFCIQEDPMTPPLLLLEFAVPTAYLAREMQHGLLRIALECDRSRHKVESGCSLYDVPIWCLYCNGRKVGFAIRRQMTAADAAVLRLMRLVTVGAGVLPMETKAEDEAGELMYLRASFDRVIGSVDSESFHMINPPGSSGQELSIFLLRS